MLRDAHAQLEAAQQAAAAASAALEAARRDPVEEQRKQNALLARAFKAEHFSGAGALQLKLDGSLWSLAQSILPCSCLPHCSSSVCLLQHTPGEQL